MKHNQPPTPKASEREKLNSRNASFLIAGGIEFFKGLFRPIFWMILIIITAVITFILTLPIYGIVAQYRGGIGRTLDRVPIGLAFQILVGIILGDIAVVIAYLWVGLRIQSALGL